MNNYVIQEWDSSYYCWDDRIWKYGKLAVCSNCICFFEKNSTAKDKPSVAVELGRVTGFQRRLVSLLFKAVVVSAEGVRPLWLSSLQNREDTYYFLQHFWQQRLLLGIGYSREQNRQTASTSTLSERGKRRRLFEVLYDSENTLAEAADSLHGQGEQLAQSSHTMNKMHKDLSIAETLLNGLDRWFTKWDIRPEHFHEIDLKREFPVLYRIHIKNSFNPGTLVMTEDQTTILDAKRVAVVTVLLRDLTSIIVNTPWSVTMVKSVIGEPDFVLDISSAHVVYIVKALQPGHVDKFEYEEPSLHTNRTVNYTAETSRVDHKLPVTPLVVDEGNIHIQSQSLNSSMSQEHRQRNSEMDKADLETVCGVVSNMKSLAIGIRQEMNRQLDSLDQLAESVDKANYRIEKDSRKLRDKL